MKLDLDMPLQAWHTLDEILEPVERSLGLRVTDINPLEIIQEIRRTIATMETPQ